MRVVGEYQLGRTIGSGSTGKVKHALHIPTSLEYAIKIIPIDRVRTNLDQVTLEVMLLRQLQHPNIVTLHDLLVSDTNLYIVMQLLPGGELFHLIGKIVFSHILDTKSTQLKEENLQNLQLLNTLYSLSLAYNTVITKVFSIAT